MKRRAALQFLARAVLLGGIAAAVIAAHQAARPVYPHLVYFTGWSLFGLTLALTGYNVRKKLPLLGAVSSRVWFLIHVYLGLFTGLAFLLHLAWRLPAGRFEWLLAGLFTGVTLSGVAGWWLSRTIPRRLTTVGGEVLFEHIPAIRRKLREKAEALVLKDIAATKASTLAEFYAARLKKFFFAPANLLPHLAGSSRQLNALLAELATVSPFLGDEGKRDAAELAQLLRQKDALDFHRAHQLVLKGWLFVHIPLTYALLVFTVVHVVLVYAISGGAR